MPGQHSQPILILSGHVTCHLHFRQNDWGPLLATAVTGEWNAPSELAHKVNSGEGNSPATPAVIQTHNLSITYLHPVLRCVWFCLLPFIFTAVIVFKSSHRDLAMFISASLGLNFKNSSVVECIQYYHSPFPRCVFGVVQCC